jgi:indole-3-glycerol phosphate synthase
MTADRVDGMSVLEEIKTYKLAEVARAKAHRCDAEVEGEARAAPAPRGFAKALRGVEGPALIAEIKKASPSKGLIREDFDPPSLARAYAEGGATCLSVLTDGPSFQGGPEDLAAAHAAVSLPVLRKDFLYDTWQVSEARAMGADCVLIIMAAVSFGQAKELEGCAIGWGMDVLLEVHDEGELDRALQLRSPLIGINNRDLATFETNLETTRRLAPMVEGDRIVVAESGIGSADDIASLSEAGAHAFLVGESLMRQTDVAAATRKLLGA